MSTPDHADWNTPSAIASYIANGSPSGSPGGVPLLHGQSDLETVSAGNLPGGGVAQQVASHINIGYELYISAQALTATLSAQLQLLITFFDTALGAAVDQVLVTFWPSNSVATKEQALIVRGPTRGNQVQYTLTNSDPSHGVNYQLILAQSGRVYSRDSVRPGNFPTSASVRSMPSHEVTSNLLAADFISGLAAGTTHTDQLPPYLGRAHVHWDSTSATTDCELVILANDDPATSLATGIVFDEQTGSTGNGDADIALPGIQCYLQIINHNAAAKNVRFGLTALDY
jgi:hypothetical protein